MEHAKLSIREHGESIRFGVRRMDCRRDRYDNILIETICDVSMMIDCL